MATGWLSCPLSPRLAHPWTHLEYGEVGLGGGGSVQGGGGAGFAQVTLMDCDDLEGWQVQVREAGVLQVVEVPLRQGVPAPSTAACHHASQPHVQRECPSPHPLLSLAPPSTPSALGKGKVSTPPQSQGIRLGDLAWGQGPLLRRHPLPAALVL